MKICQVVPWFPSLSVDTLESRQGIFDYRQTLELRRRGNEFKIISIKWRGQSHHELIEENVEVYRVPSIFVFPKIRYPVPNFFALSGKIKEICEHWQPNLIIYSHMIYLTTLPVFWLKNRLDIPSIVTTDVFPGISWFWGNRIVDNIGYLYSMLIGRRIFKLADGVQFVNSELEEYAGRLNVNGSKTFCITRGVDTGLFRPAADLDDLRRELGIGEGDTVVLYVGRLDLVKGVKYLLEAGARVLSTRENLKFLIVGDGSLRQEYERFARPFLPNIIFTGWRDDIPRLMNIADIFVIPSLSEGAANVAMEASASGLPVIATGVGEVPRIVPDGVTGILTKPKDVNAMAEAMEKLIDNPALARQMGAAGRKRMEEKYDWQIVCEMLEKAYQKVVNRFRRTNQ